MKQGWEIKKLGEVATILNGYAFDSKLFSEDSNDMPLIRIRDIKRGYTETFYKGDFSEEYIIRKGDYLVGMDGEFNIAEWKGNDALLNQRVCKIVAHDIVDRYLFWYMPVVLKQIEDATPFVTVKHLSSKQLLNTIIPVPHREEQERIVAELDCLSGVIEKKREQLKELDALAQSIFYQMFGDPITNEKGWQVKKLEELCDIINGFAFPSSDFAECNPIKVIKITNVGVNEFICDDSSLPEEYNNMEGCKVHTGDIVIALTRTIITTGVKRAIVPNEYNESLVNQRVAAILANDRIVSRRFIYSFLGTDFVRQYILQKATALMQPNLSIRDLRDMPTIYPPFALQQEFADKIEAIEKQKELIKKSISETETLFNARMDYYFN